MAGEVLWTMKISDLIIPGLVVAAFLLLQKQSHAEAPAGAAPGAGGMAASPPAAPVPSVDPAPSGPECDIDRYAGDFWDLPAPPTCLRSCPEGWVPTEVISMTGDRPWPCTGLECLEPICHNQSGDTQSGREPLWLPPGAVSHSDCDRFAYYERQHGCRFPRPSSGRTI